MKTALISVYHKEGISEFALRLVKLGWSIIASGGTARHLKEADIPVKDVAELVGGEAILGHRVVTLSREVHAGLLADPNNPEHVAEMEKLGLPFIDLVCCDFYPLSEEIMKSGSTIESVVEQTDIGGPTMVRAAAKGGRIVICDPNDRENVLALLESDGGMGQGYRDFLRSKAEAMVTKYTFDSACYHSGGMFNGMLGWMDRELAYGENRDQSPAYIYSTHSDDPLAWDKFKVVSGKPGYINMADGDKTLQVMCLLMETFRRNFGKTPFIAIACKHGNPCGAATDWDSPRKALLNALLGDADAVMGAEVMTNFTVTGDIGELIYRVPEDLRKRVGRDYWGVDVVFSPEINDVAVDLLGKRESKSRRLLINQSLYNPAMSPDEWTMRPVRGGWLQQKAPTYIFDRDNIEWVGDVMSDGAALETMILAWAIAWRANSNTVVLTKDRMLIGPGVGQQDRRACCKLAIERARNAGHATDGSIFASDAFFPFAKRVSDEYLPEGPELLARAGCIGGVVPADGKKLEEVKEFFGANGMRIAFLPKKHRGFSQH
jgi:phosphoribosylaminoimidazolecarboxamide formyltransferase/IMP cyclohydrolase